MISLPGEEGNEEGKVASITTTPTPGEGKEGPWRNLLTWQGKKRPFLSCR